MQILARKEMLGCPAAPGLGVRATFLRALMPIEKILVLEDELVVRKNLEQHLRNRGYEVAAAPTLTLARHALARDNFDVVLADVRLPDGEGTELLLDLQSRPQKPLFIMMSRQATRLPKKKPLRQSPIFTKLYLKKGLQKKETFWSNRQQKKI